MVKSDVLLMEPQFTSIGWWWWWWSMNELKKEAPAVNMAKVG
jgi:hypothetical protein